MATTRSNAALALAFIVSVTAACGGSKQEAKAPSGGEGGEGGDSHSGPAEVGKPAPDLSVESLNGKGKISNESLSGKVAIVDFWATWCAPCKQSFPKLEEMAKKYAGKVEIVGVSVDDSKDGVADWAKENGATFAIGWDDGHANANRWKVGTMPTTYILDSSGTVRYIHDGYRPSEADEIQKELVALQAEPVSAPKGKGKEASETAAADPPKEKEPAEAPPAAGDGDGEGEAATPPPPKKGGGKGAGKGGGKGGGKKPGGKKQPKKKG
ncbi:MAG: TlpA family protein disulfide reductase [Labilithrix sp.]|nr:TlpA family protein disulfide reductase [Labilithrix sp.]